MVTGSTGSAAISGVVVTAGGAACDLSLVGRVAKSSEEFPLVEFEVSEPLVFGFRLLLRGEGDEGGEQTVWLSSEVRSADSYLVVIPSPARGVLHVQVTLGHEGLDVFGLVLTASTIIGFRYLNFDARRVGGSGSDCRRGGDGRHDCWSEGGIVKGGWDKSTKLSLELLKEVSLFLKEVSLFLEFLVLSSQRLFELVATGGVGFLRSRQEGFLIGGATRFEGFFREQIVVKGKGDKVRGLVSIFGHGLGTCRRETVKEAKL